MHSDQQSNSVFTCALCGKGEYKIVVSGKTSRQQAAGHGEISMEDYACTNRGHGKFFQVVECVRCRLRSLFPLPHLEAIEDAYTRVKDSEYLTIEPSREVAFTKLIHRLGKFTKPSGKLLDIGCYTGVFPMLAQRAGWDAYGIEPSHWAASIAQQRLPGKVQSGYLSEASWPEQSFDVVTSWDVIEHVTNPAREIALMARALKPGGWLFLSTMASDARVVKLLGSRWPWYMPMHLFYFTPKTLGEFVRRTGLIPKATIPYPHYTTIQYGIWKLEPYLGPLARLMGAGCKQLGISNTVVKIDMGDFFLLAAQKKS